MFIVMKSTNTQKSAMTKQINKKGTVSEDKSKSCFVIMPISDVDGYDSGHFDRVYDHLIKPACENAGFKPIRADKNNKSNYIVVDILKQILNSDMAICDLSARNSNVFFELGLRQAFNLKTVLIKDNKTPRSFDISGLRCVDYSETLRVDDVKKNIEQIAKSLTETFKASDDEVYSLVQLLAVEGPAKLPTNIKLSEDSSVILREIQSLREDMKYLKHNTVINTVSDLNLINYMLPNGEMAKIGTPINLDNDTSPFYESFGVFEGVVKDKYRIRTKDGIRYLDGDDKLWKSLTIKESLF